MLFKNKHSSPPTPLPYASVTKAALQTVATATNVKWLFDKPINSYRITIDTTNNQFKIQEAGIYSISFWGQWVANAVGLRAWEIYINSVQTYNYEIPANLFNNAFTYGFNSPNILLSIGDTVEFHIVQSSGGNLNFVVGTSFPIATIIKLSDIQ